MQRSIDGYNGMRNRFVLVSMVLKTVVVAFEHAFAHGGRSAGLLSSARR